MRFLNLLESKANKHRKGLKVYWWRPSGRSKRNFGDEITPIIIERLWGIRCLWTRLADCDMVGAGSVIDIVNTYNPKGHTVEVWGSGLIEDGPAIENPDINYHLVRGPLTAKRVSDGFVPSGDPGLLASKVFAAAKGKTHRVGIVPHMRDLESDEVVQLGSNSECLIISPYQTPEKVAKDITACEVVFSSSLHGLIFADSFGVPNFRIKHNELEGGDYKFNDYYLSTNRSPVHYSMSEVVGIVESDKNLEQTISAYSPISNLSEIQDTIEAAFPYKDKV